MLVGNTLVVGLMILSFSTVGTHTPVWQIVVQALVLGFFTSLQYTSMTTLVYADVSGSQTGGASAIAGTAQQLSISFGVAGAGLIAAVFVPPALHSHPDAIIHGAQQAFLVLGILTVLSAAVFMGLRANDGEDLSRHDPAHPMRPSTRLRTAPGRPTSSTPWPRQSDGRGGRNGFDAPRGGCAPWVLSREDADFGFGG